MNQAVKKKKKIKMNGPSTVKLPTKKENGAVMVVTLKAVLVIASEQPSSSGQRAHEIGSVFVVLLLLRLLVMSCCV